MLFYILFSGTTFLTVLSDLVLNPERFITKKEQGWKKYLSIILYFRYVSPVILRLNKESKTSRFLHSFERNKKRRYVNRTIRLIHLKPVSNSAASFYS